MPKPKTDSDPIAVKGGVLRHVTKNGRKTNHFLIDVAFNPYVLDECARQQELEDMLVSLALDFVEDFAELKLDRKSCRKLREEFVGPQNDIQCSLDEHWRDGLSKESGVDIGDSLLRQLSSLRIPDHSKGIVVLSVSVALLPHQMTCLYVHAVETKTSFVFEPTLAQVQRYYS